MSSDTPEKYAALVTRLYEKTQKDEISWEIDWNDEVTCNMGEYNIFLRSGRSGDGEPLEYLELKNTQDQVIDNFSDAALSMRTPSAFGVDSYYELMGLLRKSARRKALGADKAIDSIINKLG